MTEEPRATPLNGRHEALGARLVDFAGWRLPIQYTGILGEHRAVRQRAGLFDLCHMGELFVEGPDAGDALAFALTSEPRSLAIGRAHYSMICAPDGGILDDLIVYRLAADRFMVVANASNAAVVSDALAERLDGRRAVLDDRSLATALVAIQGPAAGGILAAITDLDLDAIRYYGIAEGLVTGVASLVARTGYTGEDGFEVFVDADAGTTIWDALMAAGEGAGLVPVGLGARDTLRLEAGMPLYGNELDRSSTPFEAGLERVVNLAKEGGFVGRDALAAAAQAGLKRRLVGLVVRGRGIARHGHAVWSGDRASGVVTSGTMSPTLGLPIAMAYVAPADSAPGTMLDVEIRDARAPAEVVALPFYTRPR
ncbi:MAG TPA: glycine cleavage system aminomethyltransferase GcvT [Patescibacteria group bacterium]|nr:glycine cleavage system aminomethyltransferase GcvT [Patescibacteria group bacterium]